MRQRVWIRAILGALLVAFAFAFAIAVGAVATAGFVRGRESTDA